jgi:endonuclease-3 related protein
MDIDRLIGEVYVGLREHFGHLVWWSDDPLEVLVGAILTQRTDWRNVEAAIRRLRDAGLMELGPLAAADVTRVEGLIRSTGTFRQKAGYLVGSCRKVLEERGGLSFILDMPFDEARRYLLSLPGIGKETADSVLLYGGNRPVFVIDAYTLRTFSRLGTELGSYERAQSSFMSALPPDAELFRQYHAMLVEHAKGFCRSVPRCDGCPLREKCRYIE